MLYLLGLGLWDETDVSVRALDIAKKCAVYAELYTSQWHGSLEKLQKMIGKPIKLLSRSDLEENLQALLNTAKQTDVAIFFSGDPLAATTHVDLLIEAKKQKIPVYVVHNASIFSAIAETGLQLYKFGRAATIPYTKQLAAVRDAIETNKAAGLHTLLLLDIDPVAGPMFAGAAIKLLLEAKIIKEREKIVVAAALGSEKSQIVYDTAAALSTKQFLTPAVVIIPGKLHFREKDALELL
ncbi:MAG: diphthine synthase [Candidatus Aenigmatarchaeota archaeon]|nr:diphthine synthase [Candidatus Aenigmarchaeota archaeon]